MSKASVVCAGTTKIPTEFAAVLTQPSPLIWHIASNSALGTFQLKALFGLKSFSQIVAQNFCFFQLHWFGERWSINAVSCCCSFNATKNECHRKCFPSLVHISHFDCVFDSAWPFCIDTHCPLQNTVPWHSQVKRLEPNAIHEQR